MTTSRLPPLLIGLLGALVCSAASAGDPDRGELVAAVAGCAACHTVEGGAPYAGGHPVETPFGIFYGSNLTPDPEHGLAGWSLDDFSRALRHGRAPDGMRYWPAFPFPAFTAMNDADVADLWAHLQAQAPSATPNREHEVSRGRWQLRLWRPLAFHPRGPLHLSGEDTQRDRGAYLVRAVAHCGECHTPRGSLGGTRDRRFLGGSDLDPEPGPNITPHAGALGDWTVGDWVTFLETGMTAEGDFVGGQMRRVVDEGTARLPDEDRRAMATYLMSVDAVAPRRRSSGSEEHIEREPWE